MPAMKTPRKTTPWQIIASGRVAERVPRVSGYQYYALPFLLDDAVDWEVALAGIDPRATLISIHPIGDPKAGQIYPTDLSKPEDFLGVLIDGHNFEQDQNATIVLQGALELRYLQSDPSKPWGVIDPLVEAALTDLGVTRIKNVVFWDATRKALK